MKFSLHISLVLWTTFFVMQICKAQVKPLYGSDTLFDMTRYLLESFPETCGGKTDDFDTTYIDYLGGGSTMGYKEMVAGRQPIAPMSKALTAAECAAYKDTAEALVHSIGGVALYRASSTAADQDLDCTSESEQVCAGATSYGLLTVNDVNGIPGIDCPGCTGNTYLFSSWKDVLALAYFGLHKNGVVDCASDVRYALAGLPEAAPQGGFESDPLDCTTDCFERFFENATGSACTDEKCNLIWHLWRLGDGSGTTETFRGFLKIPASASFCNGNEGSDNDPIRRPVHPDEDLPGRKDLPLRISSASNDCTGGGGALVAEVEDTPTLGWLLPIAVPPAFVKNTRPCRPGSFDWKPQAFKFRPLCEDGGGAAFAQCLVPRDENGYFGCIDSSNNPSFSTPVGADTRAHNWVQRLANGSIVLDAAKREMASAYYNIHAAHAISTDNTSLCNHLSGSLQLACLSTASPCSVGYSGVGVDTVVSGAMGLSINGIAPNPAAVRSFDYPMARYHYLTTLTGFDAILPPDLSNLVACFADRAKVDGAAQASGLVPLSEIHQGVILPVDICP